MIKKLPFFLFPLLLACNSGTLPDDNKSNRISSRSEIELSALNRIAISDIDRWTGSFQSLPYDENNLPLPMGEYCFGKNCFHFVWFTDGQKDQESGRKRPEHFNDFDSPGATCYSFSKRLIPEHEVIDRNATRMIFPDTTFVFVRNSNEWKFVKSCVINSALEYDSVRYRAIRGIF